MAQKSSQPAVKPETPAAFRAMVSQMELEATAEDDDFGSPMVTGIVHILEADTEDDMWDADDLEQTGGRDLVDVEQTLLAYTVKYSTNPGILSPFRDSAGRGMYLLIRSAKLATPDEPFVWNTSAPLLVSKILWLVNRDKFYGAQVVIRGRDLGGGQTLLLLKPVPKRAYQGAAEESPF